MKTICPNCATPLEWEETMRNQKIACPSCNQPVKLGSDEEKRDEGKIVDKCPCCQQRLRIDGQRLYDELDCPSCQTHLKFMGNKFVVWRQTQETSLEAKLGLTFLIGAGFGVIYGAFHPDLITSASQSLIWGISGGALAVFYFLPSFIASSRKHAQIEALIALNLFGGLIYIGWVAALVWALIKPGKSSSM